MPELLEVNVSYSVGLKVNLGNYESADFHLSESHRIDVSDMTVNSPEEIDAFVNEVRNEIATRLGEEIVARGVAAREERDF